MTQAAFLCSLWCPLIFSYNTKHYIVIIVFYIIFILINQQLTIDSSYITETVMSNNHLSSVYQYIHPFFIQSSICLLTSEKDPLANLFISLVFPHLESPTTAIEISGIFSLVLCAIFSPLNIFIFHR